jgi:hypothetical protein
MRYKLVKTIWDLKRAFKALFFVVIFATMNGRLAQTVEPTGIIQQYNCHLLL